MPFEPEHVLFASYGNDSVALIQWCHEKGLENIAVLFNDTGWAEPSWLERVATGEAWVRSLGMRAFRTECEGMEALVRRKKGWPFKQRGQFCTQELKRAPTIAWLDHHDPDREALCMAGIRRSESRHRATYPERIEDHPEYRRDCWYPLVRHTDEMRDALVAKTPLPLLPHRSQECYPCINANKADLRLLSAERVAEIEAIELSMGYTRNGKLRTMFRPAKVAGEIGIRGAWHWAHSEQGKHIKGQQPLFDLGGGSGCDSDLCGG